MREKILTAFVIVALVLSIVNFVVLLLPKETISSLTPRTTLYVQNVTTIPEHNGILWVYIVNPTNDTHMFKMACLATSNAGERYSSWEHIGDFGGNHYIPSALAVNITRHETLALITYEPPLGNQTQVGQLIGTVKIEILDEIDGFINCGTFDILQP